MTASWWLDLFKIIAPCHSTCEKTFKAIVGVSPKEASYLWITYFEDCSLIVPKHLLWLLSFLYVYGKSDRVMGGLWGVCDKTFMGAVWPAFHYLADVIDEVRCYFFVCLFS